MKIKLFVFSFVFLFGCQVNNRTENGLKVYSLENTYKADKLRLSELGIKDIRYLPLETTEECVIASIDNLYFHDYTYNKIVPAKNSFFFKNSRKIFRFNYSGEFEKMISPIGRGPAEVDVIFDFDVDVNTNDIYILSAWQRKIKIYNEDGDYLREINLPNDCHCGKLVVHGDKIILYCGNYAQGEFSYIIMDFNGNILKYFRNNHQFLGKSISGYAITPENIFYKVDGKLFKKEAYSDTIYSFAGDSFVPHMVVDEGDRLISPEVLILKSRTEICDNYIQPMNLFEFGDFVFYQYIYIYDPPSNVVYNGFIGSKTGDFAAVFDARTGIVNDIDGGPNFQPLFAIGESEVVSLRDPFFLKSYIKSDDFKNSSPKNPERKREFERFVNSLEETDNPVLIFAK